MIQNQIELSRINIIISQQKRYRDCKTNTIDKRVVDDVKKGFVQME